MRDDHSLQNIPGMLVFLEIAEAGSFSGAARRLGLSKASVSRQIRALEQRLGTQLLRRTTRRMSLTEVGEVFLAHCRRVGEEAEAAERSVGDLLAEPRGEIRLAAPMSFGHLEVAPRLPAFLTRHPQVRIHLDLTDRRIDLVREKFDLAVRIGNRPTEQTLVHRRLCRLDLAIVASPEYLAQRGAPESPEALPEHNCLSYAPSPERWSFSDGRRIPTRGDLSIDNGDALRRVALLGHGITYLPSFLVREDIRAGRLVSLFADQVGAEGAAYAVYPESRHLSPKVRALIDFLVKSFGGDPD
jgi:DNA-binding transcriptional LysR family regulator